MNSCGCTGTSSGGTELGGLERADFGALDALALKLTCLDSGFSEHMRAAGRVLGRRVALDHQGAPLPWERALSLLVAACGLDGVVQWQFVQVDATQAQLKITGCAEALGWSIPNVGRPVCAFDTGLFEGFLCGATGTEVRVRETACMGLGQTACEFRVVRGDEVNGCRAQVEGLDANR